MANTGADERKELLDRFLQELESNRSEVYFDESDLVEIYDYARDTQDFRVCLEVLLVASRLYPKSVAIGERLAFYMYELGSIDGAESTIRQVPESSVLRRLLLLQIQMPPKEKAIGELNSIVDAVDDFEDEWAIRLVDIAGSCGAVDWLKENYVRIKSKCSYPQSFIYEMFELCVSIQDHDGAQQLGEELTLLEPFNEEFWELLGELRIRNMRNFEAGLNDVEYALAINPRSCKALQLKAEACMGLDKPVEEIMQVLNALLEIAPDEEEYVHTLALALYTKGYEMEAIQALEEYRAKHPDSCATITYLVLLTKGHIEISLLEPLFRPGTFGDSEDDDDVIVSIRRFAREGEYSAACTLMLALEKYADARPYTSELFELLYRSKRYSDAVSRRKELKEENQIADLVAIFSALRVGDKQFVTDNVDKMIACWTSCDETESYTERITRLGTLYALGSVRQSLIHGVDFDLEAGDPFTLS